MSQTIYLYILTMITYNMIEAFALQKYQIKGDIMIYIISF